MPRSVYPDIKVIPGFLIVRVVILTTLILLSAVASLHAHGDDIKFQRISIEEGLSQSDVNCIIQDRRGFMWFGTEDGLNRYDGYSFKIYKRDPENPNSLSYDQITAIYEDRSGVLWIGTYGGGLNKLDPKKEHFTHCQSDPNNPNSLSHDYVNFILEDRSGVLWIATEGGLNKFDPKTERFIHYKIDPNNPNSLSHNSVHCIYEDLSGTLWIGTDGGLNKLNPNTEHFIHYRTHINDSHSLSSDRIMTICADKSGALWIGTDGGGLNKLVPGKNKESPPSFIRYQAGPRDSESLSNNKVMSIFKDNSGLLWVGTYGGGLNRLVPSEKEGAPPSFIHYQTDPNDLHSLSNNRVMSIYEDQSGVLWIGTDIGLNKFDKGKKKFILYQAKSNDPNSLSTNFVRPIYEDRSGTLWIGTYGGGLNKFIPSTKKGSPPTCIHYKDDPNNPNSLSNNLIRSICEDRSGMLWIGTEDGLNKFDSKKAQFTRYYSDPNNPYSLSHNYICSIHEDRSGTLWIGTQGGLNKLVPSKNKGLPPTFIHYKADPDDLNSLSHDYVYCIYEDRSGVLWIGTFGGGLNKLVPAAKKGASPTFIHYQTDPNNPSSLNNNRVISIHEDQSGTLWIGTASGGLNKLVPGKNKESPPAFIHYGEEDGLANNRIYGILEDDHGNLWLSHNKGLTKFNPQTEMFKNYDVSDGLQGNEFNGGSYYKNRNGEMFFGGINGLNRFYPDEIRENTCVPQVVITDLQIFNKPVPIREEGSRDSILERSITETEEMKLSYKDRIFSFEFAALHYAAPEKNEYAYMMEGFERDWNYVGNRRFATYTNLPPGDYVFRVKASNNDGVWNEEGVSVKIKMMPPLWKTWWFQSLSLVAIIAMIFTVYQVRTHNIRERSRQLEERVELRTNELKAINKKINLQVTKRKKLENEAKRRAAQASLILEAGQRLSSELELETLLSEIVTVICEAFNYYGVMMLLLDEKKSCLTLQALAGAFVGTFPKDLRIPVGEGMIGQAAARGETQVSGDVSQSAYFFRKAKEETKSELSVPIKSGDKVIGVLDIQSNRNNAFDETDVAAMVTLSTQIATAIQNARFYEQAQQEIAVRRQAEEEIEKRQLYLESVLHNAPDAIVTADASHRIIEWNSGAEKIFGYTRREVLGKNVDDIVTGPDVMEEAKALTNNALSGEKLPPRETVRYRKDGSPINVIVAVSPIKIGGKLHGAVGVYTDITDLKRAEEALKESEKKYRTLFNHVADPVLIFDKKTHHFLDCNKAVQRIYGYSIDELRSMTPYDLHPQEELNKVKSNIYVKNVDEPFAYTHLTKDGRQKQVEILSDEIDYQGSPAWISIVRDITNRKTLEDQLKDFAYIVSHDLKAPLRAISQLTTWISKDYADSFDDDGREQIKLLLSRVKRMDNLIDGILQYSRASRMKGKMEEVDLNNVVREVLENIASQENIKVTIKNKLPVITADRVRMEQVFQNLIGNAAKYMDKPEGKIKIGCEDNSIHWKFSVEDNGPGIDKKYHEKIFQIFQTLESRDKRESTGVGLSVVKKIIELYDGKIWVKSKKGEGSTFFFTLKKRGK